MDSKVRRLISAVAMKIRRGKQGDASNTEAELEALKELTYNNVQQQHFLA